MSKDLKIIKEIKKIIKKKISHVDLEDLWENERTYSVDENNNVIGLNLDDCKLSDISALKELNNLTKKELRQIVIEQILPEQIATWDFMGYELKLSEYKISKLVNEAHNKGTGARGLQAALDKSLEKATFNLQKVILK